MEKIDGRKTKPKVEQTMESLLAKTEEDGDCLIWQGYVTNKCPHISHAGKVVAVRRLMLLLQGDDVRATHYVVPSCGNPLCVNPEHIEKRTGMQHYKAMARAPRNELLRRARMATTRRKLDAKITMEIARLIRESDESGPTLAARYGIDKSRVNRIKRGEAWSEFRADPFSLNRLLA